MKEQNCNDCENFKVKGETYDYWNRRYFYGECGLTGEYKTTLTPCIKKYTDQHRWCIDEYIQYDRSDFCKRYNHDCENCFSKEFWEEIIAPDEVDKHFVNIEGNTTINTLHTVYYICKPDKRGGFDNAKFNVQLDNGEFLEDIGLWCNGSAPNQQVINALKKGRFIKK